MLLFGIPLGLSLLLCGVLIWVHSNRAAAVRHAGAQDRGLAAGGQELVQSHQRFEESRDRFAHDLRGPLQAIMGYADLLAADATGPLNPKQRSFLEKIRAAAIKITDIIDQERK
jgi:signal transduction histidine kinase